MHHMFTYKENVFKELFLDKLGMSVLPCSCLFAGGNLVSYCVFWIPAYAGMTILNRIGIFQKSILT